MTTEDATVRPCWKALMNYSQADMDGVFVTVSRQAIHECKEDYDTLRDRAEAMATYIETTRRYICEEFCGEAGDEGGLLIEHCLDCKEASRATAALRKDFPKGGGQ